MHAQQLTILSSIHLLCQSDEWNKETSALLPNDLVCFGGEMHVKDEGILLWMAHTCPQGIKTISLCSFVMDSRTKSFSSPELTQRHGQLMFHSASRMHGSLESIKHPLHYKIVQLWWAQDQSVSTSTGSTHILTSVILSCSAIIQIVQGWGKEGVGGSFWAEFFFSTFIPSSGRFG